MSGINFDFFPHLDNGSECEDTFDQMCLSSSRVGLVKNFSDLDFFIEDKVHEDWEIMKEDSGLPHIQPLDLTSMKNTEEKHQGFSNLSVTPKNTNSSSFGFSSSFESPITPVDIEEPSSKHSEKEDIF